MTVLFDDTSADRRTHALVIGVGEYEHVDDPRVAQLGLDARLTSPPKSAQAIVKFLQQEFRNPTTPLGSLALLISPTRRVTTATGPRRVDRPTFANINASFRQWIERCNRSEDNIAIFYFCGHGLARGKLALLASDFGDPAAETFSRAVNFDDSQDAMATSCRAKIQCFFADACRSVPSGVLSSGSPLGAVIPDWNLQRNYAVDSFALYASLPTDPAYGQTDRPSAFTSALLRSLRGYGSRQHLGEWWVTTMDLADGVEEAMDYAQRNEGAPKQKAQPSGGSRRSFLHQVADPGSFPITISLRPDYQDFSDAELSLRDTNVLETRHGGNAPWEIMVKARQYTGTATFTGAKWQPYETTFTPTPPRCDYAWEVTPCST